MEKEAEKLNQKPNHDRKHFLQAKAKLETHKKEKCLGAIIRSRAQYTVEGEKCTIFPRLREKETNKKLHHRNSIKNCPKEKEQNRSA